MLMCTWLSISHYIKLVCRADNYRQLFIDEADRYDTVIWIGELEHVLAGDADKHYELGEEIGRGGCGRVCLVEHA
jgi:hypothetical protein